MAKTYLEAHSDAKVLIVDYAESIGGTWAHERLYPGLKTNNLVGSYEFSDFPLVPEQYGLEAGQHIPGRVVHHYLQDFCDAYGLTSRICLRTKVESATLLLDGGWQLSLRENPAAAISALSGNSPDSDPSRSKTLVTSRLVLATGLTSEPFMPNLPGLETFQGSVFHAKDFKARAQELAGARSVVVIGGNKSAWDVCYSAAARFGVLAHMVMRRTGGGPSWVWPAKMKGYLPSISAISSTRLFTWFDPNPYGSSAWPIRSLIHRTWLGRKLSELFWRCLDAKVVGLNAYGDGPGMANLKPWSSTFWMGNSLSIHNYESSWFDLAANGQITTHAAEVSSLSEMTIHLSDGTTIEADAVVCCTGWKTTPSVKILPAAIVSSLGFPGSNPSDRVLEEKARADVLRAAPVLGNPPVRRLPIALRPEKEKLEKSFSQSPSTSPYRLYRFVVPCDPDFLRMRNLAVIGAHITLHTAVVAQAQALWITAFFDGKLPRLDTTFLQEPDYGLIQCETFLHTEYQRLRRPKGTGGMGDRCPDLVFDSLPYVDLLLSDMGIQYHRKSTWYREITESYRVADFKGLVQEWLFKWR